MPKPLPVQDSKFFDEWIAHCIDKHVKGFVKPKLTQEQCIAAAYGKLRKGELVKSKQKDSNPVLDGMFGMDAIVLRDQVIAAEGILPYIEGGKVVKKLKRWSDLKMNASRIAPVIDEHPPDGNGNNGLYSSNERIWGYGFIKADEKDKKLRADLLLFDKAPVKRGYSIGYPYFGTGEPGKWGDQDYDEVQENLIVDHIALCDSPRYDGALQAMDGSKNAPGGFSRRVETVPFPANNGTININAVAADSIIPVDQQYHKNIMDIARRLRIDNPTSSNLEIIEHAAMMLKNRKQDGSKMADQEKTLPVEEKVEETEDACKTKKDSISTDSIVKLEKENATLKAKLQEMAATDSLKVELKTARDQIEAQKKIIDSFHMEKIRANIDSMIKEYGCEAKDFDGKTPEFVEGALWYAQSVNREEPDHGHPVADDSLDTKPKTPEKRDYSRMRYSFKKDAFVPQDEWTG